VCTSRCKPRDRVRTTPRKQVGTATTADESHGPSPADTSESLPDYDQDENRLDRLREATQRLIAERE
jgi:hypothetical protein